jgi:hypothetical protein
MKLILNKTLISGFSLNASPRSGMSQQAEGVEPLSETISLNFSGIELVTYDGEAKTLDGVHHHLDTGSTTLKRGPELEVVEVKKKVRARKKSKKTTVKDGAGVGKDEKQGDVIGE